MDPGVLAMLIPIAAIVCGTYITVERMKSKRMDGGGGDVRRRLDELDHEVGALREQLAQAEERIDFTERLLAKQKDAGKIGA